MLAETVGSRTHIRDLRDWLAEVERLGELRRLDGVGLENEVGAVSELNYQQSNPPALLFDRFDGYAPGWRILTGANSNARRTGLTFRLGANLDDRTLVEALRGKPLLWEQQASEYQPSIVDTGPVMENMLQDEAVDLDQVPVPLWHEHDGGYYIGTGCAVITSDPDQPDWLNLGSYRMMRTGPRAMTLNVIPGKHGRLHYEKWFEREGRAPVAVSLGHDPLLTCLAGLEVPTGISEYAYAGAIRGESLDLVRAPRTGLLVPADAEMVLEGWIYPDKMSSEGPFGEWTGYYTYSDRQVPVLEVESMFFRSDPIMIGSPPSLPPHDYSYFRSALKSAMIYDALVKAGVTDVKGVWAPTCGGGRQIVVVSIRQRFYGHSRQAGFLASQLQAGAYMGKYVIVVDDDVDPTNMDQVLWAMCTRADPAEDIDFIRKAWGSRADPLVTDSKRTFNSRAIIDACIPFDRINDFPRVARSSPEVLSEAKERWGHLIGM